MAAIPENTLPSLTHRRPFVGSPQLSLPDVGQAVGDYRRAVLIVTKAIFTKTALALSANCIVLATISISKYSRRYEHVHEAFRYCALF
jgi:hypothetical protein